MAVIIHMIPIRYLIARVVIEKSHAEDACRAVITGPLLDHKSRKKHGTFLHMQYFLKQ